MTSSKRIVIAAVALAMTLAAGYLLHRHLTRSPAADKTVPAVRLGLVDQGRFAAVAPSEEAEFAALESGGAERSIDAEIEKAGQLMNPLLPDSDEHRMLSRRVKMLRALKEKMRK